MKPNSLSSVQVRLEWPTDLAINPMDNSIYVLDNNVVLQITENRQVFFTPTLTALPAAWAAPGFISIHETASSLFDNNYKVLLND